MNTKTYESIVSKTEIEELKEMIFKRARERAEALNKDVQNSYTSSVQNDIMDLARNSFNSSKNPFAIKTEVKESKEQINPNISAKEQIVEDARIKAEELKRQIQQHNEAAKTEYFVKAMEDNMADARMEFNKPSFIGALEFLNSQATVALVKKKGKAFEAMA